MGPAESSQVAECQGHVEKKITGVTGGNVEEY